MRAALADPSLFGGLVLISTTAGIEDPDERARRRDSDGRLADLLESGEIEDFETTWRSLPLWQGDPDWVTRRSAELRAEADAEGLAESLRGFGSGSVPPVWNDLGKISLPTGVLAGDRDSTYCELADRLATALPDCVYTKVSDCGHSIPIERPDDVALAIEGISRRPRPGGS